MRKIFSEIIVIEDIEKAIFPEPSRLVNVGSRAHRKDYLAIYAGYDCETTAAHVAGCGWRSAVYMHQLALANEKTCVVYLLRTWEEILALFDKVIEHYQLTLERRIILWDANLSYEFAFLQHRLEWGDFFAKEELAPLLASYASRLDFREALTISGGSLAHLAKTYCYTQKLEGDLDYTIPRNCHTYLTEKEKAYCINDVVILAEFSRYIFKHHIIPDRKIPMTKTGILLQRLKKDFRKLSKEMPFPEAARDAYLRYINKNYPDEATYFFWFKFLFRGGYVHANALYAGNEYKADMYDIKSSYPSVMLTDYVPRGKFERVEYKPEYLKSHCCIMYASFYDIELTTTHTVESENKIIYKQNARFDNGRLISADRIDVMLTEIDFSIYRMFYKWNKEKSGVSDFWIAKRGKLPRFLRGLLVENYLKKEELSAQGLKDTIDYKLAKENVNALYGACVKRIRLDSITYEGGEWKTIKNDKDFSKEIENNILLPQWGIWITSAARFAVLSVIYKLDRAGVKVLYCDTDSIKYIPDKRAENIIADYNRKRKKKLWKRGYRQAALATLGGYEKENKDPVAFKTLGAKRYIYEDENGIHATIAGMPKQAINNLGLTRDVIFEEFSDYGFILHPSQSMKKTTAYTNESYSLFIDGEWMNEESGVALYDIPFSMTIKDVYSAYLAQLQSMERIGYAL